MITQHNQTINSQIKYKIYQTDFVSNCKIDKKREQLFSCTRNKTTQQKKRV